MNIYRLLAIATLVTGMAVAAPINLVPNGNFELGNNGEFSSDYTFVTDGGDPDELVPEGLYTVTQNSETVHPSWVPTGDTAVGADNGAGLNIFLANGSPDTNNIVWRTTNAIAVDPNTIYFFEAYVANLCCRAGVTLEPPASGANLAFERSFDNVNWTTLNTLAFNLPAGSWEFASTTFNTNGNAQVWLRLRNSQDAQNGNDFAVDDIYLNTRSQNVIPEPSSMALAAIGGVALVVARLRRK